MSESLATQTHIVKRNDAIQDHLELYPGVEEYYLENQSWLKNLGMVDVLAFNAMVDKQFEARVAADAKNRNVGFAHVTFPSAKAYTPTFLKHMDDNKEKYQSIAEQRQAKQTEIEARLADAEVQKPIRRKRTNEARDRMEQTLDAFFSDLDHSDIEPHRQILFVMMEDGIVPQYEGYVNRFENRLLEIDPSIDISAIVHAKNLGFRQSIYKRTIKDFVREGETQILFHDDTFETAFMNTSAMTVGNYGEEVTKKIAQTVAVIGKLLKEREGAFAELHEEFGHSLVRSKDVEGDESVPMLSLYEGVLSVGQALNTLVQDKVEGYDNPDELIEDLVNQGVLLKFARTIGAVGLIGPLNLLGYKLTGIVHNDTSKGKLILDKEYVKAQEKDRKARLIRMGAAVALSVENGDKLDTERMETVMSLEGCPATVSSYNRDTGESRNVTQEVAKLFVSIFKSIDNKKLAETRKLSLYN